MKTLRLTLPLSLLLLTLAMAASSSGLRAAQEAAPENTGLPVGKQAPRFTLKDQAGREVSLDSLLKKGPVALVFYRSADW
jgi:cytochrome oxidase Cu insertion factor (SCO1/SenC/PrrC family)